MRKLVGLVVVSSLLVACGGGGGGGGGSSGAASLRYEVVNSPLSVLDIVAVAISYEALNPLTDEFERRGQHYDVTLRPGMSYQLSAPLSAFFVSIVVEWSDGQLRTVYGFLVEDDGYTDGRGVYVLEVLSPP